MFITFVSTASVGFRSGTLMMTGPRPADLIAFRHRALVPRVPFADAAIIDQHQALAFEILEIDGDAAIALAAPADAQRQVP